MEYLEIVIADDRLKAFLTIDKVEEDIKENEEIDEVEDTEKSEINKNTEDNQNLKETEISLEDVEKALSEKGISYGIDWEKIEEIIENKVYSEKILIAEGKPPIPGKDGKLIYHFEEKQRQAGTMRDDGTIDFHSLDLINNVRVGEPIVTKVDPEPGKKGINIKGDEILPPKVENPQLPRSKNTVKKDNSLYSAVDGQIVREFQKIVIKEVFTVNGDVDLNTGNIDFVGSVQINGDVKEGFKIKAEGDIEIAGKAGACELISGGNILIKKGFIGRNKGTAKAAGDFFAKFIENVSVEAENVRIYEAVMHSKIKARDSIEVTEGKGLIVGGKITARNQITANLIGSSLATKTLVEIGMMPELKEKLKEAKDKNQKLIDDLNKIQKSVDLLENIQKRGIKLPANKRHLLEKLETASVQLTDEKRENEAVLEKLKEEINVSTKALVHVKKSIFSGVQILTAHDKKIIQNRLKGCKFKEVNKEIRQISD